MSSQARDSMLIYLGKLRGILSILEFDENDDDSFVKDKINDVLDDMEITLKSVDEVPYA